MVGLASENMREAVAARLSNFPICAVVRGKYGHAEMGNEFHAWGDRAPRRMQRFGQHERHLKSYPDQQ
jgi:hypothetical protein